MSDTIPHYECLVEKLALLKRYRDRAGRDRTTLLSYQGCLAGEVVFCLGNGPSLLSQDCSLLEGCNVISTNYGFRYLEKCRQPGRVFNLVTDSGRLLELLGDLSNSPFPSFVAPSQLTEKWMSCVDKQHRLVVLDTKQNLELGCSGWNVEPKPEIGSDFQLSRCLDHCGYSVAFAAIQLARFLGSSTIVLLGVDMDYSGATKHFVDGVVHLNPGYQYEVHAKPSFIEFNRILGSLGIRLLNATQGGRVDVLDRISLDEAVLHARMVTETKTRLIQHHSDSVIRDLDELTCYRVEELVKGTLERCGRRRILLWGANSIANRVASRFAARGVTVHGMVDRRGGLWMTPSEAIELIHGNRDFLVVVCTRSGRNEVLQVLGNIGYTAPDDVVALWNLNAMNDGGVSHE